MNRQNSVKNLTGALIAGAGIILLLNSIKAIDITPLLSDYWPVILIIAAAVVLFNNIRSWPIALLLGFLGGMLQLQKFDIIDVEPWAIIWPLVIIYVGLSLVFKQSYAGKRASKSERDDVTAILGGAEVSNSSKKFKQSNITAIMGGATIDLRKTEIEDNALVEIFSFWGGIEIIVPDNIVIRNQVNSILAGNEDKTNQSTSKKSPTLTIAGTTIMSGVSIRNHPS